MKGKKTIVLKVHEFKLIRLYKENSQTGILVIKGLL